MPGPEISGSVIYGTIGTCIPFQNEHVLNIKVRNGQTQKPGSAVFCVRNAWVRNFPNVYGFKTIKCKIS